jgi:CRISPR-associated protein Cmr6
MAAVAAVGEGGQYHRLAGVIAGTNTNLLVKRLAWLDDSDRHFSNGLFGWFDADQNRVGERELINAVSQRNRSFVESVGQTTDRFAVMIRATTLWRLMLNASPEATPSNAGISLHHTLGHPVLWSTSLRGAAARVDSEKAARVFGRKPDEHEVSRVGVGDGQPTRPVKLRWDAVTPHLGDYGQAGADWPNEWTEPVPVSTLSVAEGSTFEIPLWSTKHPDSNRSDLETAVELVVGALEKIGLGAKTSSGYGYFHDFRVEYVDSSTETETAQQ